MRRSICLSAALPLILAACASEPAEDETMQSAGADSAVMQPAGPATGMDDMASTVSMAALGESGVSGEAILTPSADQTEVSVTLNGLEANASHPGHIHQGSCDAVGSVVVPLSPITADASGSGTMTTTAAVNADSVMAGGHIVVYHDPGGTPMVCGAVGAHVM